jgi:cytoskeletal protein CcmA (bactofilin family)
MAQLSTLIAEGVEITGNLLFTNGMRIDGRVKGDVTGRPAADGKSPSLLVLSANGHIEGSVRCGDAVINGTVIGDLDVEHRLELQSDARVTGTIRYRQLQMDVGATVQGHLLRVAGRRRRATSSSWAREGGRGGASLTGRAPRSQRPGQRGPRRPPHSMTMPASLTAWPTWPARRR